VIQPGKIVCVGRNYVEHAQEMGNEVPKAPLLFLKPPSSILRDGDAIVMPRVSQKVEFEGEIGIVVGSRLLNATREQAESAIGGVVALNDVTARDLQRSDGQWTRAKGFDTFCPVGPWIVTEDEIGDAASHLQGTLWVNGEIKQDANTRDMIFPVAETVALLSECMTLEPGDLVVMGTPAGVGHARKPPVWMKSGDVVEIEIEQIGLLRNEVRDEQVAK